MQCLRMAGCACSWPRVGRGHTRDGLVSDQTDDLLVSTHESSSPLPFEVQPLQRILQKGRCLHIFSDFLGSGAWICQSGAWTCQLGAWNCLLGAWICQLGVWICQMGVWTCPLGGFPVLWVALLRRVRTCARFWPLARPKLYKIHVLSA